VARHTDPIKIGNRAGTESLDGIEELLAIPPLSIDDLFDDPTVRCRIGEWISLAMSRAARGRQARRRRRGRCRNNLFGPGGAARGPR
jgi:hypothetical protein